MMTRKPSSIWLGMACAAISVLGMSCAQKELEPTPPEQVRPATVMRPAPEFKAVKGSAEAVQEAGLTSQPLPQLRSHLEIRTILVRGGQPVGLPVDYEGILELRTGSAATITDGKRQPHQPGEMWQVQKGSRVTVQASGELAVLRAIYLIPSEK